MGQVLQKDNIATLQKDSSTQLSLPASIVTIGGQQFNVTSSPVLDVTTSGAGGLDTGSLTINTEYTVYAVQTVGVVSLVASLDASAPTGFTASTEVGGMFTDGTNDIFPTVVIDSDNSIGDMKQSMLSIEIFRQENGLGWVLADGTTDVTGSRYHTLTGNTVPPDARGVVLRGRNYGRSTATGNADGDTSVLGTHQADEYISHDHGIRTGISTASNTHVSRDGGTSQNDTNTAVLNSGGNETRMRNITVNTFMKVN